MKETLLRIVTLDAQNVIPYIYIAIAVVWLVMVVTALFSVRSLSISAWGKVVWCLIIVLLPLGGLAIYCFRCLLRADYPFLTQLGIFGNRSASEALAYDR